MNQPEPSPKPASKAPLRIATIIGIFIAVTLMALAARNLKSPEQKRAEAALLIDGRLLGNAAQQYLFVYGKSVVDVGYDPVTGSLTGDLTPWITSIHKDLKVGDMPIELEEAHAFTLAKPNEFGNITVSFTDEGKVTPSLPKRLYEKVKNFFRGLENF